MNKLLSVTLLLALCFLMPAAAAAQKTLARRMSDDFCTELNKRNIPEVWSDANLEQIGLIMVPIAGKYAAEIEKEYGLTMDSQEDFQRLGEIIGAEAGENCPKFKRMIENMVDQSIEGASDTESLKGAFIGLETSGPIAILKVKDSNGREQKIWWLEPFPGAERLVQDPAALKNKNIEVRYREREMYSPALKDYVKVKVAAGIEAP